MESGSRSLTRALFDLVDRQAEAPGDQGFWLTEHQVGDQR